MERICGEGQNFSEVVASQEEEKEDSPDAPRLYFYVPFMPCISST
jgi:hypothetical protein